jgi:hypothetical protein
VIKGTCVILEIHRYQLGIQDSRNLAAKRSNTNKHSIGKINITPNIGTNCIIMIYASQLDPRFENHEIRIYGLRVMISLKI